MLKHWKQEKGSAATYEALCGALKHRLVQRQDLAEQFCYINGPSASQLPAGPAPEERVTGEVPGTSAQHQENSSGVKSNLKRKSSDPNPERGNLPFKIFCASASSRNTGNQDPQEERLREEVNRYMKQKIDEVNSQGIFDYSEPIGIHRFYAYLVGERNLIDVNFGKSSIKVIVKCRTVEILEGLWRDYCCGHLNVVAEECLITETVKEELCMETIKLKTTILEEDYVACKLSLMEIPAQFVPAAAADVDDKGDEEKLTALQTQGNDGLHSPKRPDRGTVGRPIRLRANFFRLNISPQLSDLYRYDVEITAHRLYKCPQTVKRDVVNEIIRRYKDTTFQGHHPAFDGMRNLYSRIKLPSAELSVKLPCEDGNDKDFKVKIQFVASVSLLELKKVLSGKQSGEIPQDAVRALDIVMREMPSLHYTPIERSFFPFDGPGRLLDERCEVQVGFYSSVRHSEWKAMLVNIDVSEKVFDKSQDAIGFLCEIHGPDVTPQSLEDRSFPLDKQRLEKAIRGIRIQTTLAASIKRKYTVWGVTDLPAEKLQFDVQEELTGRKVKTTVVKYFKDRYNLPLRYPHLPCLQVSQKKDYYLPLEVCTLIPCERRYLTDEQIENLIKSTARSAPERQRNIRHWAREMIQTSKKYLKEEFQTSVSPLMVRVDGRVLPAPKIKLGPQDQALVPRDGSWDLLNNSFHEGAQIETWALACFVPSHLCGEDDLRKFGQQMASVSCGEGMKMTEEPAVMTYAKADSDVENLFCKWVVEIPDLQLIMVVLPERSKRLYPEIKRVGDIVLGIPTQCVLSKYVQQAKPDLCANIALKINAKLGGINHVIDLADKSPVFREPVIIFGADVTHIFPSNKIPSIAAVVASMDTNAAKYRAQVRAQSHYISGGFRDIINDLAAMVKELLIEFYKANRTLKPSKIVFYRNGVSKGRFDQVLVHEVRAVQEACMMLEKEYRPGITFVVVQKRHHTRLFCEDKRDASGADENVPPGTTVDSGITHPYEFDFYLCSHFGIQGTSRPTHYHVLYDDNAFTADGLQQLTYQLCHLYARCNRSVSMPAPAYYAHLVAFRARHHVTNGENESGSGIKDVVDLEKSSRAIQVNYRMKGAMYFT
ncbi:protein argonaute-2-like isoform X2 [Orbicella faveolata]|uniref:protein argonaute-2-like isoform X2 n=1 Tax=Orbicella faveolata TaxID=48498 RepID=UPI0009E5FE7F|nr:protein argonaute-2-like isoform X2 [Orbicella faveolata]